VEFIVTACRFCNDADNRYLELTARRGIVLDNRSPEELVALRKPYVENKRAEFRKFWAERVAPEASRTQRRGNRQRPGERQ